LIKASSKNSTLYLAQNFQNTHLQKQIRALEVLKALIIGFLEASLSFKSYGLWVATRKLQLLKS